MSISLGPYERSIPFVNIQDIRFDVNEQGQYVVILGVSNEKVIEDGSTPRETSFGNFIYFSRNKTEIDSLSSSQSELLRVIRENGKNRFNLRPTTDMFTLKATAEKSNSVYSYLNRKRFVLEKSQELYVLVCSYIETNNAFVIGNIAKETIITNDVTPINATVYTLDETVEGYGSRNTVWPGSVHLHNNQFMAGNAHVLEQHPDVTPRTVLNVRLKDLRVIKAANSLNYKFEKRPAPYFSPVTLSRVPSGDINGSFTFNRQAFAENVSKYGGLIKNNETLLSTVIIKDVVIYQKISDRDIGGNALTTGKSTKSGLEEANIMQTVANLNNNCSIVANTTENTDLLEIFFTDNTTTEVNSGAAEYKAEVIVEDKTGEMLNDLITRITSQMRRINDVQDIADSQAVYNAVVIEYLAAVSTIFGTQPFKTFSQKFWRKNLLALVNRFNPNYDEDKQLFIRTISNFVAKLESIRSKQAKKTDTFNVNSAMYISKKDGILTARKSFVNKYTFTGTRDFGLSIIDNEIEPSSVSVPTITFDNYKSRARQEVSKYEIVNTQATALNPFGFLSAQSINLTPNPTRFSMAKLNAPTSLALPLIQSNTQQRKVLDLNKNEKPVTTTRNVLNTLNVNVAPQRVPLREVVNTPSRAMARDIIDAAEFLSETSDFIYEDKANIPTSGSKSSNVPNPKKDRTLQAPLVQSFIERTVTSFKRPTGIVEAESLQGSPALQKLKEDSTVIASGSALSNAVNFNSVVQVQYLASYDTEKGITQQNWNVLTPEILDAKSAKNQPVVCKMVKVSSALGVPDILNLEPMSSMFVIGTPQKFASASAAVAPTIVAERIRTTLRNQSPNIDLDMDNVNILYSKNVPVAYTTRSAAATSTAQAPVQQNPAVQLITSRPSPGLGY